MMKQPFRSRNHSKEAVSYMERLSESQQEDPEAEAEADEAADPSASTSKDPNSSTGTSGENGGAQGQTSTSSFSLARADTRRLLYSKVGVLLVIVVVTCIVAYVTYRLVYQQEDQQFHAEVSAATSTLSKFGLALFMFGLSLAFRCA